MYSSTLVETLFQSTLQFFQLLQRQNSSFFRKKYQDIAWNRKSYQAALRQKIEKIVQSSETIEITFHKLEKFLSRILQDSFFESANGRQCLNDLRTQVILQYNSSWTQNTQPIAALLLDAENLQLDAKTEDAITKVCQYSLRIKIAFADWRQLGSLDRELHARGYDLIQVPGGRDHADGKMITIGSSIQTYYLNAQTIFVCSSDSVMTNLCNHLQRNGFQVYRVTRQGNLVEILNYKTQEKQVLTVDVTVPSQQEIKNQLTQIIQQQQQQKQTQWVEISEIEAVFEARYNLGLQQVVSYYNIQNSSKSFLFEFLSQRVKNCILYQHPESSKVYVTLFQIQPLQEVSAQKSASLNTLSPDKLISPIQSSEELK